MKEKKVNELEDRLNSPDETERIYAVQDIGDDPEWAVPLVGRLEIETSAMVKDSILFHLRNMPCHMAYESLFRLFQSQDPFLRNSAVAVFGSESDEAVAFLTAHLDDADREVRKLVLDALFLIRTPDAVLALRAGMHDLSLNVRITAVEYLGRLETAESLPDMIELLQTGEEPMLKSAILESMSRMDAPCDIRKILSILDPEGDIYKIDPIYLPFVFRLTAGSGDLEFICRIIGTLQNVSLYAGDIVRLVEDSGRRFENLFEACDISETILSMTGDKGLSESIRYQALESLLKHGLKVVDPGRLFDLGEKLVGEPKMMIGGLRLLSALGHEASKKVISEIQGNTDDEEIRLFCEELLMDFPGNSDR